MAKLRSVRNPPGPRGKRDRDKNRQPLPVGQVVIDTESGDEGAILESANQYAHPQAAPVFVYLIRWDDGQVQSLSENALKPGQGIELVDS